jgi:hypothetical protein
MIRKAIFLLIILLGTYSCGKIFTKNKTEYAKVFTKYDKIAYLNESVFYGKISLEAVYLSDEIKEALKKDIDNNNISDKSVPFPLDKSYPIFLVAFYQYDNRLNNLDESNAFWSVILKVNDKKYDKPYITKLFKSNHKFFEPYFKENQRFSTYYLIEFKNIKSEKLKNFYLIFSSAKGKLKAFWRL